MQIMPKAKEKGCAELTTITAATTTTSAIHQDALNTQFRHGNVVKITTNTTALCMARTATTVA